MKRQVYLENWQEHLESTINALPGITAAYPRESAERQALLSELIRLEALRREVKDVSPDDRELIDSAVIPWSVREPLELSQELIFKLGDLFDIYRRFRIRLEWRR